VRRDVLGVPSQVIGVALRRIPESLMNPMIGLMRRLTVPDLDEYGLPAPAGDGFNPFLRSRTVPILDHGFVAAIRKGGSWSCLPSNRWTGRMFASLTD